MVLFTVRHLVGEHYNDAVVILIEEGACDHHAIASADADISVG
jgi:hypothetical protein